MADAAALVELGRRVLRLEAGAVSAVADRLDQRFDRAVRLLAAASGRVIVSGVGKSGLVARKIAATLTSTGTPASYLHPVDSLHGDLGIVGANDVAIVLSKSGESQDLYGLVGTLQRLGVPMIAQDGHLAGVLTTGDLTRMAERDPGFLERSVSEVMTQSAKTTSPDDLAGAAVGVMQRHGIIVLPVVENGGAIV